MHTVEIKHRNGRHIDFVRNTKGEIREFATKQSAEYFIDVVNSMVGPDIAKKFPIYIYNNLK